MISVRGGPRDNDPPTIGRPAAEPVRMTGPTTGPTTARMTGRMTGPTTGGMTRRMTGRAPQPSGVSG
jgi:hypothetical protein